MTSAAVAALHLNPLKIAVLLGSHRQGRLGVHLANQVVASAKALGHEVALYDAAELKLPILEKPFHHYKPDEKAPAALVELAKNFEATDSFIIVDGEYNHGPTPGMLNLIDHFHHNQFKFKTAGLATYGAMAGGARASYALRNVLGEVGMVVAPTAFFLPTVWEQIDFANGELKNDLSKQSLKKFLNEFTFLSETIRDARAKAPK
jgi:NAD(P)H-dependent FMN reductase